MQKTNILFDAERMKYPNTGLFHFCNQLGTHLQLAIQHQLPETVLTFYLPQTQIGIFGNHINYILQKPFHKWLMPFAAKYALWHNTYQGSNYYPSNSNTKFILTVHDLNFLHEQKKPHKVSKYLKQLQAKVNRANTIVTISNYVKAELQTHIDVKGKEITTIYNGCTINILVGSRQPANVPASDFIFSIGIITRKKNFHVLPALLVNNNLHLVIAGICQDKNYWTQILQAAQDAGVADRVHLIGAVSEAEKNWLYENCSAFAFASIAEGFGLPVVEAMYFGKPVFLSTKTSLPEIGGELAYYFNSFEPYTMQATFNTGLQDFYNHPLKSAQLKERAALFSWQKAAQQYLAIYQSLM